jgi:chemotaxis protein histidine kinase CheA
MSRFGADNEVRTVFTADASGTVAESQRAADAVEKSAERQQASIRGLRSALGSIRGALASLGGSVAIGFGLAKIFDGFLNRADDVKEKLREIGEESRALLEQTAAKRTEDTKVAKEIDAVREAGESAVSAARQRAESLSTSASQILLRQLGLAPTQEEIDREVENAARNASAALQIATETAKRKQQEEARKRRSEQEEEITELEATLNTLRLSLTDDTRSKSDQLFQEYLKNERSILRKIEDERDEETKKNYQKKLNLEREVFAVRSELIAKEIAEEEKKKREANEKIAKEQAEYSEKIANEFAKSLSQAYKDSMADQRRALDTSLNSIAVSVSAIKDLIRLQSIAGQQPGDSSGVEYGDSF